VASLVECVPNFSEGRRVAVVDEIAGAITHAGAHVLDRQMDPDHNRSVITFAAEPWVAERAAFDSIQTAARLISLETHQGEHPRIGATDVVPFVPLRGVTMDDCVAMARRLGARVGSELNIPVYMYAAAAVRAERQDLANIRRGEYESLKKTIASDLARAPDYGPRQVGPAGAVAIGARDFLIAFNVNLATSDLKIAQDIARVIREQNGGLKGVKAKGFRLRSRNLAQVSMNLTDYRSTGMLEAFERVQAEAEKRGVKILACELVGLAPMDAVAQTAAQALHLPHVPAEQILELKISDLPG
jgi:glutamate formiminotransferase